MRMQLRKRLPYYARLMRWDKPIGAFLLLWPTWWALWLASSGWPQTIFLLVFTAGVFFMRSAGCVLNDFADRHIDGHVERTRERPLASGKVSEREALLLAAFMGGCAFLLVLLCNRYTIYLAFIGAGLTIIYPLMKRVTSLPQVGLGFAFSWGIPMAFAAVTGSVSKAAWFLFATGVVWSVIYDTLYAMTDREDDKKIGVKSTAILFGAKDKIIVGLLQLLFVLLLIIVGQLFQLRTIYYCCLLVVSALFIYQQYLIKHDDPIRCFQAFLNNNWVGLAIFAGVCLSLQQ